MVVRLELEPAEMALTEGLVGDEARFFFGVFFFVVDVFESFNADGRRGERGGLQGSGKGGGDDE